MRLSEPHLSRTRHHAVVCVQWNTEEGGRRRVGGREREGACVMSQHVSVGMGRLACTV